MNTQSHIEKENLGMVLLFFFLNYLTKAAMRKSDKSRDLVSFAKWF